jgi:hypothetical protein
MGWAYPCEQFCIPLGTHRANRAFSFSLIQDTLAGFEGQDRFYIELILRFLEKAQMSSNWESANLFESVS